MAEELSLLTKIAAGTVMIHVPIWAMVCFFLFLINLFTTMLLPPWFIFPTLGWGLGVAIHILIAFLLIVFLQGKDEVTLVIKTATNLLLRFRPDSGTKEL